MIFRATSSLMALGLLVVATGCSGTSTGSSDDKSAPASSELDPLFGAPTNTMATPNSLNGLWAWGANPAEVRLKIADDGLTVALRCNGKTTVGGLVAARVTTTSIQLLEGKTIGDASCQVSVATMIAKKCSTSERRSDCYAVDGLTLQMSQLATYQYLGSDGYGTTTGGIQGLFTKLSD